MVMKTKGLIFLVALTLTLLTPFNVGLVSAQSTTVTVSPQSQSVEVGQNFSIDIVIIPATEIAGAQFDLNFDPSLLTVTSVEEGNLFKQGGASTYFNSGTINNDTGTVTGVAGVILGPNSVSSPGTFAIVHFTAKNTEDTSSLTLSNVIVGNPDGEAVPISVSGGSVQIGASGENVENTGSDNDQGDSGGSIELIYDDFNDEELDTNLGGLAGSMSPGADYDPVVDFTSNASEGTYALSLTYDFPSGQWCGYWSFFSIDESGYDVSSYDSLKFYLKGASGGEKFKIEVTDTVFDSSSQESYLATQSHKAQVYVQATTSWQDVEILLSEFTASTDLDLTDVRQINIVFDKPPRSGTVYIDQIRFVGERSTENQQGENQEGTSNIPPVAYIDFIEHPATVYENARVVFSGHGVDLDGTITGYLWASSIDGPLSTLSDFDTLSESIALSPGTHQIRFKVKDDKGTWSDVVTSQLSVTSLVEGSGATSEQEPEPFSGSSNENVVILLGLQAAAVVVLVSFVVIKKFGYLKPAMEHISKTERLAPGESMKPAMEHIPETKLAAREPISPRISLRDLKKEVYSGPARYPFKEQVPDIPKEKWSELQMRLRRLMNSRRKFL